MTSVIQSKNSINDGGPASFTATANSTPGLGRTILALIAANGGQGIANVVDNQGGANTFFRLARASDSGAGFNHCDAEIWACWSLVAATGSYTLTATPTTPAAGASATVGLIEVAGLGGAVDVSVTGQDTGGTSTALTLTNGSGNTSATDLAVGVICTSGQASQFTVAPSSGYTAVNLSNTSSNNTSTSGGYKVLAALETTSAAWTWTTPGFAAGVLVTLLPGVVVAPPVSYPMPSNYYM